MSLRENWTSPLIQSLQDEIVQGNNSALEAFWQAMKIQGTPLYESIECEQDYCLVTFVWRGDEHTHNVVLIGSLPSYMDGFLFAERQMDHLEGTDLWYRTYRVHNEIQTTYQFSPNDPLNPLQILYPKDEEALDSYSGICSIVQRNPQPTAGPAVMDSMQTGQLEQCRLHSAILQNDRRIWLYTPPGYDTSRAQPYDLLLLFDGFDYAHVIGYTIIITLPTGCATRWPF